MSDKLRAYMKRHEGPVPSAPVGEWALIQARVREDRNRRQQRVWVYGSLALSAAAVLLVVTVPSVPRGDVRLEVEDVTFGEDIADRGAYNDWLWLTDTVDAGEE